MRPIDRLSRLAPTSALLLATLVASPVLLPAQHAEIGVFTAWNPTLSGDGPLYGVSMGGGKDIGLRMSGAMRTRLGLPAGRADAAGDTSEPPRRLSRSR